MIARAGQSQILLTDAGYRNTLAALRALSEAGYVVDAVGPPESSCETSRHLRRLIHGDILPNQNDAQTLCEHLLREGYAALLPIGGRSVERIARHADVIARHTNVALHHADAIERCMDKARLNEHAASIGLHVPRFWRLDHDADVARVADEASFPIVVKKRHELDRRPLRIIHDASELRGKAPLWQRDGRPQRFPPIAQEFVEGDGCAFFALYDRGTLRRWFMHRRLR
ncbi:MAG: hypothetical protein KDA33_11160, partial [Phycisphaerales bacterium]|nr:hypothetical protein [Phycisphaerales bacterium]